jgi:hypothetical protein
MRPAIFALLLFTSPAAFCQWAQTAPTNPAKPGFSPPTLTPLPSLPSLGEFNRPPTAFHFDGNAPRTTIVLPAAQSQFNQHAQIDPRMIVRPPQSSIGIQAPGTLIAQNLYPGLELLPIDGSKAKLQPIPTTWPGFKLEQIPIDMSNVEFTLIEQGAATEPKKK